MIRPWMGVLAVVLGFAALPSAAVAQGPTINIASPTDGAQFTQGQVVNASYSCTDTDGVATCAGPVASDMPLSTSTIGPNTFRVTATDSLGNSSEMVVNYSVVSETPGDVGGETPATLQLTLGAAPTFSPFIPGVAESYTTGTTATVVSTATNATLSVADASAEHTGHLVNGTYFLPATLEVGAAHAGSEVASTAPVGGSAAPTNILSWGDIANETITLMFKQNIAVTDALRTGAYAKSLTFTLSTTNP
jgi:hypothetical protein